MKLTFIIADQWSAVCDTYVGLKPHLRRRIVQLKLTDDQFEQIGLKVVGTNMGKDMHEEVIDVITEIEP